MFAYISCVFPLGSGLTSSWEQVHFGNTSPFPRDGLHSVFIDVEVCIKRVYSTSYSETHLSVDDCSVLLQS